MTDVCVTRTVNVFCMVELIVWRGSLRCQYLLHYQWCHGRGVGAGPPNFFVCWIIVGKSFLVGKLYYKSPKFEAKNHSGEIWGPNRNFEHQ